MPRTQIKQHVFEEGALDAHLHAAHGFFVVVDFLGAHVQTHVGLETEQAGFIEMVTQAGVVVDHIGFAVGVFMLDLVVFFVPGLHRPARAEAPADLAAEELGVVETIHVPGHFVIVEKILADVPADVPVGIRHVFIGERGGKQKR